MTTPIGAPVQYHSDPFEGYGGAELPGILAVTGAGGSDDDCTIIVFVPGGQTFTRYGVVSRKTFVQLGMKRGWCWSPVEEAPNGTGGDGHRQSRAGELDHAGAEVAFLHEVSP